MKEIRPYELTGNLFTMLDKDWMLITAGDQRGCNTMTASWGGFGVLWGRCVAHAYIRPTRYTYEFVEKSDRFTLTFFGGAKRDALTLCGKKSGRDGDKIAEAGLVPVYGEGTTWFEDASVVLICKKIYAYDIDPACMIDRSIESNYHNDYHRAYIGEIEKVLIAD